MDGEHHHHNRTFELDPVFIGLLGIMVGAVVVATYHCILVGLPNPIAAQHQAQLSSSPDEHDRESDDQERRPRRSGPGFPPVELELELAVIRDKKKDSGEDDACAVCLCEFTDGESVRVLPECMHYFHAGCVDAWLYLRANCPLCRAKTGLPPDVRLSVAEFSGVPATEQHREAVLGGLDPVRGSNNEI